MLTDLSRSSKQFPYIDTNNILDAAQEPNALIREGDCARSPVAALDSLQSQRPRSKFSNNNSDIRIQIQRAWSNSRRLSIKKRVRQCGLFVLGDGAELTQNTVTNGVAITKRKMCNLNMCPYCFHKRTRDMADRTSAILHNASSRGYKIVFLVMTVKHDRYDKPRELADILSKAFGLTFRKKWRTQRGIVGTARALEYIWNPKNGYHIHLQGLLVVESGVDINALKQEIVPRIVANIEKVSPKHTPYLTNQFFQEVPKSELSIIAGYYSKLSRNWSPSDEFAKGLNKRGHGLSGLDIILRATPQDPQSMALFYQYQSYMSGLRVFVFSRGLEEEFGAKEEEDSENSDSEVLAIISQRALNLINKANLEMKIIKCFENSLNRKKHEALKYIFKSLEKSNSSIDDEDVLNGFKMIFR